MMFRYSFHPLLVSSILRWILCMCLISFQLSLCMWYTSLTALVFHVFLIFCDYCTIIFTWVSHPCMQLTCCPSPLLFPHVLILLRSLLLLSDHDQFPEPMPFKARFFEISLFLDSEICLLILNCCLFLLSLTVLGPWPLFGPFDFVSSSAWAFRHITWHITHNCTLSLCWYSQWKILRKPVVNALVKAS